MTDTYDPLYQETLDFLYSQLPMYQRVGESAFKKGLDNISTLCQQIGYPQWKFKSIHVGGTNGKGSVSSMLSSILMEAGYNRIGLYTSPHLKEFTERIRINGQEIPRDAVVEFVEVWRDVIEKIKPSFFELTVAMAFDYFAEKEIDAAIVEVGLGGRLDSTNIIRPELSVITNISWDHMNLLGDTLPLIAAEKAGIIKPFTPVVIGERQAETASVFQDKAREKEAHLVFASDEYTAERIEWDFEGQTLRVKRKGKGRSHDYRVGLSGHYQLKNLITVLSAVDALREDGWDITDMALQRGLERVQRNSGLQGRMQKLGEHPLTLCDSAHNEAGVALALQQVREMNSPSLHIVWGMVNDKDDDKVLSLLPQDAHYYFVRPDLPRGLNALTLQMKAEAFGLNGEICESVPAGILRARSQAGEQGLVYIGGSMFVVAEALAISLD